eukprot:scaffold39107_cov61-Phaeocystis_antarctica.AAC.1
MASAARRRPSSTRGLSRSSISTASSSFSPLSFSTHHGIAGAPSAPPLSHSAPHTHSAHACSASLSAAPRAGSHLGRRTAACSEAAGAAGAGAGAWSAASGLSGCSSARSSARSMVPRPASSRLRPASSSRFETRPAAPSSPKSSDGSAKSSATRSQCSPSSHRSCAGICLGFTAVTAGACLAVCGLCVPGAPRSLPCPGGPPVEGSAAASRLPLALGSWSRGTMRPTPRAARSDAVAFRSALTTAALSMSAFFLAA